MEVVIQLVCFGFCASPSPIPALLLRHSPNQINEFVNTELDFSQEYLQMLPHNAWDTKEEVIQTADAPWGSPLNSSSGKKYLV